MPGESVNHYATKQHSALNCSKRKTPKTHPAPYYHQQTPVIIQLITKSGHGMSYSQVEENETAICLQKLAASSAESVALPESIQPHVFTTPAYDNINFIEETLNDSAYNSSSGPHPTKPKLPSAEKQRIKEYSSIRIWVASVQNRAKE